MRFLITALLCSAAAVCAEGVRTDGAYWDQQLQQPFNFSVDVKVLVLPHYVANPDVMSALRALGVKTVCHISVGTVEDWHADAPAFPTKAMLRIEGQPLETPYVDIRQKDVVLPFMQQRLKDCADAGFAAVEPDHMDIFENVPNNVITKVDQVDFMLDLATYAHSIGLEIAQKNAPELIQDLEPRFDFLIMESCFRYGFCEMAAPYLQYEKDVLTVEYPETGVNLREACKHSSELGLKTVFKSQSLEAGFLTC